MNEMTVRPLKVLLLGAVSFILCSFTLVFGAIPLHAWRVVYGRRSFFIGTFSMSIAAIAFGAYSLGAVFASFSLLVGLFNEFDENKERSFWVSGLWALLITLFTVFSGLKIWALQKGVTVFKLFEEPIETFVTQFQSMNPKTPIQAEELLSQLPSGLVLLFVVALTFALLLEKKILTVFQISEKIKSRANAFLDFRLPDAFIWLFLFSLLAAFLKVEAPLLKQVGVNVLNVLAFAYFLQGMAVISQFFNYQNFSPFWRVFSYFFLVLQLFVFVCGIGVVDFWVDFRSKMKLDKNGNKIKNNEKGGLS